MTVAHAHLISLLGLGCILVSLVYVQAPWTEQRDRVLRWLVHGGVFFLMAGMVVLVLVDN